MPRRSKPTSIGTSRMRRAVRVVPRSRMGGVARWPSLPLLLLALTLPILTVPDLATGQTPPPMGLATVDTTLEAGEADAQRKPEERGLNKYNHWDFGFTTFRIGYGLAWDFATYSQDDAAKQQVVNERDNGLRDTRLLFRGK